MSLFEVRAEIPVESAEAVNELLVESGRDTWSVFEDVLLKRAWLVGVFPDESEANVSWAGLEQELPASTIGIGSVRELRDSDWRDSYKAHFRAWKFGRLHWVPIWERENFSIPPGETVLWLDPGLAFGTGNHETTRLCVERLVELVEQRGPSVHVIDAGCGSGILALSAVKLGCVNVSGFDNDPEAVRVSEENALLNGLQGRVRFSVADLSSGLRGEQVDILLANILADVLMRHAAELTASVRPGGTLVLSGILAEEGERVQQAFADVAPRWKRQTRRMGEWCDVVLLRPND